MRITCTIFLFAAVLFCPLTVVVVIAILGLFFFPAYWESIVAMGVFDLLYRGAIPATSGSFVVIVPLALYTLALYTLVTWLRSRIRERTI